MQTTLYTDGAISISVEGNPNDLSLPGRAQKLALQLIKDAGVANIQQVAQSGIFKRPTGRLASSIRGRIEGDKDVVWWSEASYAAAQEYGVRPHRMTYLLGKTIPIRGRFGGAKPVFRRVTMAALMRGRWFHRGYPGKFFMRRGVDRTTAQVPQLLLLAHDKALQLLGGGSQHGR